MTSSFARSYVVRLAVVTAVACAAWYFGVRPLRDGLESKQATLMARFAEIEAGQDLIEASEREPAAVIADMRQSAAALRELWGASADASMIYESIDTLATRYAVIVERMEPKRSATAGRSASASDDDGPTFNQIVYSIELVGSYEGVGRFLHAIQNELGMARIDSIRVSPALSLDRANHVRASVLTTHFQSSGGLAQFDEANAEVTDR